MSSLPSNRPSSSDVLSFLIYSNLLNELCVISFRLPPQCLRAVTVSGHLTLYVVVLLTQGSFLSKVEVPDNYLLTPP